MFRPALIAAAGVAFVAGCASTGTTAGDMTPNMRNAYVDMAAASDLFEIQSSQLALTKAQRSETRQFAQMLLQHHTETTQQLTAASTASGYSPPPPRLLPMQAEMMDELRNASTASFDQVYLRQQVPAHEMALSLHQNYASDGDTPALRTVAGAAVPIVQSHLTQAGQLDGQ